MVDDFAIWRRPLSAREAADLAASTAQLAPTPGVSLVSVILQRSGVGKEAGAVQVRVHRHNTSSECVLELVN